MVILQQLYQARVMHKRLFPKKNSFDYRVYYLVLPLPALPIRGRLASFHPRDIGKRDGSDPLPWVKDILADYGLNTETRHVVLVTMPCILGYVFNPVSFYLCLDDERDLRAVLCEVHNTFGEQHTYLCANSDRRPITADLWLESEKVFHVSPFLQRNGTYKFRFDLKNDKLGIWIDYYDVDAKKQLITSLTGSLIPLTAKSLSLAFWLHPLVTLKAITLIHWQALRLMIKGIRYIAKPLQIPQKSSATATLTKCKARESQRTESESHKECP